MTRRLHTEGTIYEYVEGQSTLCYDYAYSTCNSITYVRKEFQATGEDCYSFGRVAHTSCYTVYIPIELLSVLKLQL